MIYSNQYFYLNGVPIAKNIEASVRTDLSGIYLYECDDRINLVAKHDLATHYLGAKVGSSHTKLLTLNELIKVVRIGPNYFIDGKMNISARSYKSDLTIIIQKEAASIEEHYNYFINKNVSPRANISNSGLSIFNSISGPTKPSISTKINNYENIPLSILPPSAPIQSLTGTPRCLIPIPQNKQYESEVCGSKVDSSNNTVFCDVMPRLKFNGSVI